MNPNNVISPKKRIKNIEVIFICKNFSIATALWDKQPRVLIRWNGEENSKGYPQSRGYATWFVIPKEVALAYAKQSNNITMQEKIKAIEEIPFNG